MAAGWTTKTIKDAAGATLTVRMWDETGSGPYSFAQVIGDGTGAAQLDFALGGGKKISDLNTALATLHGDALPLGVGAFANAGRVQPIGTSKIAVNPTVTASTYAVSKVIGGIMTFTGVLPPTPFSAHLDSIELKFKGSVQTVGFWVAIFDTSPAGTFTDTNTAAIATADTALLVGMYHLTAGCSALGTHTIFNLDGIGKALVGASANLYAVVVPDATTASLGSTTDMTLELGTSWG